MKCMNQVCVIAVLLGLGFVAGKFTDFSAPALAQGSGLTAEDKFEILQLINRYAYGIDTCGNNGYD